MHGTDDDTPDASNVHDQYASWQRPPLPVLRFCKCRESANIAIPYSKFYSDSFFRCVQKPMQACAKTSARSPPPRQSSSRHYLSIYTRGGMLTWAARF